MTTASAPWNGALSTCSVSLPGTKRTERSGLLCVGSSVTIPPRPGRRPRFGCSLRQSSNPSMTRQLTDLRRAALEPSHQSRCRASRQRPESATVVRLTKDNLKSRSPDHRLGNTCEQSPTGTSWRSVGLAKTGAPPGDMRSPAEWATPSRIASHHENASHDECDECIAAGNGEASPGTQCRCTTAGMHHRRHRVRDVERQELFDGIAD
jgi:hypothetical protein